MKGRLTCVAFAVVLLDVLALSAVWHAGPTLALTVALAVPDVDTLVLARLLPRPVSQSIMVGTLDTGSRGLLYRTDQPRSALVLVRDDGDVDPMLWRLAATLARHDVAVLVPDGAVEATTTSESARTIADELGRALGVPARVERATALRPATLTSPIERAGESFRLLRIARALLAAH